MAGFPTQPQVFIRELLIGNRILLGVISSSFNSTMKCPLSFSTVKYSTAGSNALYGDDQCPVHRRGRFPPGSVTAPGDCVPVRPACELPPDQVGLRLRSALAWPEPGVNAVSFPESKSCSPQTIIRSGRAQPMVPDPPLSSFTSSQRQPNQYSERAPSP